jgi:hypothetical protein
MQTPVAARSSNRTDTKANRSLIVAAAIRADPGTACTLLNCIPDRQGAEGSKGPVVEGLPGKHGSSSSSSPSPSPSPSPSLAASAAAEAAVRGVGGEAAAEPARDRGEAQVEEGSEGAEEPAGVFSTIYLSIYICINNYTSNKRGGLPWLCLLLLLGEKL